MTRAGGVLSHRAGGFVAVGVCGRIMTAKFWQLMLFVLGGLAVAGCGGVADTPCGEGVCASDEACVDELCVPAGGVECLRDEHCAEGWTCIDTACVSADDGNTVDDACLNVECDEGQVCADGDCVDEPVEGGCLIDADCAEDELCEDDVCVQVVIPPDNLTSVNPDVSFEKLYVDTVYALVAPAPADLPEEVEDDGNTVEDDDDGNTVDDADDGNTVDDAVDPGVYREAPAACVCSWTSSPADLLSFDPVVSCSTNMTPLVAGEGTLGVDVVCGDYTETFTESVVASPAPVPCTINSECGDAEICSEGFCTARDGPVLELLVDQTRVPYVVSLDLRLEDELGAPIASGVTADAFRIYEDDVELDYDESAVFVTSAPYLPHRIMLVLDYSASMEVANAISPMVSAAQRFVLSDSFTDNHGIGVVEFHDRADAGDGFNLAVPITTTDTTGKQAIIVGIPVDGDTEGGLSRAWDAVTLALDTLSASERQPGEVRSIVVLTDGKDTTSEADADSVLAGAVAGDVNVYVIGFGDTTATEDVLQALAEGTGGTYFGASDADVVNDAFSAIALDLHGQWNLRYITQRNTDSVSVRVAFAQDEKTGALDTSINAAEVAGDAQQAIMQVVSRAYDDVAETTTFGLRADYVPRHVSRFRFVFGPLGGVFSLADSGGLTTEENGWVRFAVDAQSVELVGAASLAFGAFGDIGTVAVPGDVATLVVAHDDTIFESLAQPKTVSIGGDLWTAPTRLALAIEPESAGTIVKSPDKIIYAPGEAVTLTPAAAGNYVFAQWSGDSSGVETPLALTMDKDLAITAEFYPPRILTVAVESPGAGGVAVSPSATSYRHGDVVTVSIVLDGMTFVGWSGDASGTETSIEVTMTSDKSITATFESP